MRNESLHMNEALSNVTKYMIKIIIFYDIVGIEMNFVRVIKLPGCDLKKTDFFRFAEGRAGEGIGMRKCKMYFDIHLRCLSHKSERTL